jgi:putative phosphoribosyl transferase
MACDLDEEFYPVGSVYVLLLKLLVDCGMRTGLTMQAAIGAVRTLNPAGITAAVPVTSVDGRWVVEGLADDLIYLAVPEPFGNAGVWYRDFSRPGDDSISQLLCTASD